MLNHSKAFMQLAWMLVCVWLIYTVKQTNKQTTLNPVIHLRAKKTPTLVQIRLLPEMG